LILVDLAALIGAFFKYQFHYTGCQNSLGFKFEFEERCVLNFILEEQRCISWEISNTC